MNLRNAQHPGNLRIAVAFEKPQRENFGSARGQPRERPPQTVPHLAVISLAGRRFGQRYVLCLLARPQRIKRYVHSGASQVAFRLVERLRGRIPAQEAQEYSLQNIFGISGIAGDPICRSEDQSVAGIE